MVMVAASRVEGRSAIWAAGVARKIRRNGERSAAGAAKDSGLVPFGLWPRLQRVTGKGVVTVFACVKEAAAAHPNSNDVGGFVVVEAASLWIEAEAVDVLGI